MSKIEFKNHTEEFTRSGPLCDVIKVDGQLYVHISKVEIFQNQLQQKENTIKEVREYIEKHTYHDRPKNLQNGIYERGILLIKSDFDIEDLLEILEGENK